MENLSLDQILYQGLLQTTTEAARKIFRERRIFEQTRLDLIFEPQILKEKLDYSLSEGLAWASKFSFRDMNAPKTILETFIELDFYVTPKKNRDGETEEPQKINISEAVLKSNQSLVLLGLPGAGKTTISKFLFQTLLTRKKKIDPDFSFPLIIRLRESNNYFKSGRSLIGILNDALGLCYDDGPIYEDDREMMENCKIDLLKVVLENLRITLILDGFDEVSDVETREIIVAQLDKIFCGLNGSRFVMTSRTADYIYSIPTSIVYEICPLTNAQISDFTSKWLKDSLKAQILDGQIQSSPFKDTAIRPLTLAHLCAIFERYGRIPDKPRSIYRKIIFLLLEEWDAQRKIERYSSYAGFDIDRKMEFLSRLSFELTVRYNKLTFTKTDLEKCYKLFCESFRLPVEEALQVVKELESHSGLIVQISKTTYEFAHKSIQEFLSADYLIKLYEVPSNKVVMKAIPNELAISVSLSSDQSYFFSKLVLNGIRQNGLDLYFITRFLARLILEKPDFLVCDEFAIAVLYIYSTYVGQSCGILPKDMDLRLEYLSTRTSQFESNPSVDPFSSSRNEFDQLPSLIAYFLSLQEFKGSLARISKFYIVVGDRFKINFSGSKQLTYNYIVKLTSKPTGPLKHFYPKFLIVNDTCAGYFMSQSQ